MEWAKGKLGGKVMKGDVLRIWGWIDEDAGRDGKKRVTEPF